MNSHADAEPGIWSKIKDTNWDDGRYRLELQGWVGSRSGNRSRSDDVGIVGSIEREFALGEKLTVGLRVLPLFYYDADEVSGDAYEQTDIWGAGFGVTVRRYFKEVHEGWYFEFMESIVAHDDKFNGNSGSANFMSETAFGYEFDNHWHLSGKLRHLSNGGWADDNSGVNAFGVGVGLSF